MSRSIRSALDACRRIAAGQHGIIAARQAIETGVPPQSISRLVRTGSWARIHPSVFALWVPSSHDDLWLHNLTAGAVWLGAAGAASHRAAGLRWELDGVESAPIELSTSGGHRSKAAGLVIHRVTPFRHGEVVVLGGLRVTSVIRTLLDLCAVVKPQEAEMALESALRRGRTTLDKLSRYLEHSGTTRRGRTVLRSLLEQHPGIPTDSPLETLFWQLRRDAGLPAPVRQHPVRDLNGDVVANVDFAFVDLQLAIEVDGHEFHSRRRDWERDRARQNALTRLGWTVYRPTWDDVTRRPDQLVADISELILR